MNKRALTIGLGGLALCLVVGIYYVEASTNERNEAARAYARYLQSASRGKETARVVTTTTWFVDSGEERVDKDTLLVDNQRGFIYIAPVEPSVNQGLVYGHVDLLSGTRKWGETWGREPGGPWLRSIAFKHGDDSATAPEPTWTDSPKTRFMGRETVNGTESYRVQLIYASIHPRLSNRVIDIWIAAESGELLQLREVWHSLRPDAASPSGFAPRQTVERLVVDVGLPLQLPDGLPLP